MPKPEYVYGTIYIIDKPTNWFVHIIGRMISSWNKKRVFVVFDRNPYTQQLSVLEDDPTISFSNYQWNNILPFTIYRKPYGSEHPEYYHIVRDESLTQK